MLKGTLIFPFSFLTVLCVLSLFLVIAEASHRNASAVGHWVQKHERTPLIETEYGEISAVKFTDGTRGPYHLQFITLEPSSLFLPVLLHADMVFYVHTGSGTLSWTDDKEIRNVNLRKGDIYRLHPGSVFYVQSSLKPEREKFRIHAIFSNAEDDIYEPWVGAYSSITDLVLGFDSKVLQAAFKVPEDVIEEVMKATKPPGIIHAVQKKKENCEWQARLLKAFLGRNRDGFDSINGKKKRTKAYNVLEADPDFKNCNGWSLTVDRHDLRLLKDSNVGVFMVNLTKGSMMGPHWNPRASEIAIVLQGQGMVRVVCPGNASESECKSMRIRVKEGDVLAIRRFHPMAQMSFNNDSFVFMGFSTSTMRNYPQFLAGKSSVLQVLDRQILAMSLNVTNTTIHQLLTPQKGSVILECTSCAEEEESKMEKEIEREREQEEEARKKEEEEEARKREEEARKIEEEEAKKRREEDARKEQREARRQEEERQRRARQEEEEKEKQEREKKQEEERRRKEEKEQVEPKRRKGEKERHEERSKREEAAAREQEEARRQEKERQRRAEQEEEEARREREKPGREPGEGDDEGERTVLKKVWKI
ncbi:PREDICTED: LOW QUALITY PROTEIN: vicilin-like seed storage protein At2g18540 [Theobroma cacao]|uniref:LOW QUALITY PROTEIN: vicilin-like seed storage protein At2g18540 n=1 Tax=Theobroma cacao TaxID=3641 RepID=A0AB32VRJ7_THECC|nr:PREDICTED: LOW QUALITY PROTEIN: vicilin-like seed storage protein At2g18540 [Theobroma cacao]